MLGQQRAEEIRIQPAGVLQSVGGRVLRDHPQVERRVSEGKSQVDQQGPLAGAWASATAKFEEMVVTPQPPFTPRKTNSFRETLLPWEIAERRIEIRASAPAISARASGRVRYSRAPARMKRTACSSWVCSE